MQSPSVIKIFCGLFLALGFSAAQAQYGYVPQPVPGNAAYSTPGMDPNMNMAPTVSGGPGYAPQQAYSTTPTHSLLTYGQLEANYSYIDLKDSSLDGGNGIDVSLMVQLFKPFFLHGEVNWVSGSGGSSSKDFDFSTIALGGGVFLPLFTDRVHLVLEAGGLYSSLSAEKDSLSFNDGAFYISPMLRVAVTNDLELQAGVTLTSADNYDTTTVDLGGYYRLFSWMDLGLGASLGDVTNTYHAGIRFRW